MFSFTKYYSFGYPTEIVKTLLFLSTTLYTVRFQVFKALTANTVAFCDVTLCSLVEAY
jgi:hypothetical protein